jgi:hypothetical protein
MYLYGGVTFTRASGQRRPADAKAGLVHAYRFATGTWQRLATEGARGLLGGGEAAARGEGGERSWVACMSWLCATWIGPAVNAWLTNMHPHINIHHQYGLLFMGWDLQLPGCFVSPSLACSNALQPQGTTQLARPCWPLHSTRAPYGRCHSSRRPRRGRCRRGRGPPATASTGLTLSAGGGPWWPHRWVGCVAG